MENKTPTLSGRNTLGRFYMMLCDCWEHAIGIQFDDDDFDFLYLAFWHCGRPYYSFRDKLRHIWQIIRYGHPYCDNVLLTKETAAELCEILNKFIKRVEVKNADGNNNSQRAVREDRKT
jgi:hypothetical protein